MLTSELFDALCQLAGNLGYEVRLECLPGQGGVCELKGRRLLFVDTTQHLDDQIEQVATAIAGHPDLAHADLDPAVRQLLHEYGARFG